MKFRQAVAMAAGILAASALGTARAGSDSKTATGMVDARDYTLEVVSDHGNPVPAVGTHSYAWQSKVSCSVEPAVTEGGNGYVCTGWVGEGSVSEAGSRHDAGDVTLTALESRIEWQWESDMVGIVTDQDGAPPDVAAGSAEVIARPVAGGEAIYGESRDGTPGVFTFSAEDFTDQQEYLFRATFSGENAFEDTATPEFWAEESFVYDAAEQQSAIPLQREKPYVDHISYVHAEENALLDFGEQIVRQTPVRVDAELYNPDTETHDCRVTFRVKVESQGQPWTEDIVVRAAGVQPGTQTLSFWIADDPGGGAAGDGSDVVTLPVESSGGLYVVPKTEILLDGDWTKTDAWQWWHEPALEVVRSQHGVVALGVKGASSRIAVVAAPIWVNQSSDSGNGRSTRGATREVTGVPDFRVRDVTVSEAGYTVTNVTLSEAGEDRVSLANGLLFDSSGSMANNDPERLRVAGGKAYIDRLDSADAAAIADFGNGTSEGYSDLQQLQTWTSEKSTLKNALDNVAATGGTPMYGALTEMVSLITTSAPAENPGHYMFLFCDGKPDDGGKRDSALADIEDANLPVVSVGLGPASRYDSAPNSTAVSAMQEVANRSGGVYVALNEIGQVEEVFSQIADGIVDGQRKIEFDLDPLPRMGDDVLVTIDTNYGVFQATVEGPTITFSNVTVEPAAFGSSEITARFEGRLTCNGDPMSDVEIGVGDPLAEVSVKTDSPTDQNGAFSYETTADVADGLYLMVFQVPTPDGETDRFTYTLPVAQNTETLEEVPNLSVTLGPLSYMELDKASLPGRHAHGGEAVLAQYGAALRPYMDGTGRFLANTALGSLEDLASDPFVWAAGVGVLTCPGVVSPAAPVAGTTCSVSVAYLSGKTAQVAAKNAILAGIEEAPLSEEEKAIWLARIERGSAIYGLVAGDMTGPLGMADFAWGSSRLVEDSLQATTQRGDEGISFLLETTDGGSCMAVVLKARSQSSQVVSIDTNLHRDQGGEAEGEYPIVMSSASELPMHLRIEWDDGAVPEDGDVYNLIKTENEGGLTFPDDLEQDLNAINLEVEDEVAGCLRIKGGNVLQFVVTNSAPQIVVLRWGHQVPVKIRKEKKEFLNREWDSIVVDEDDSMPAGYPDSNNCKKEDVVRELCALFARSELGNIEVLVDDNDRRSSLEYAITSRSADGPVIEVYLTDDQEMDLDGYCWEGTFQDDPFNRKRAGKTVVSVYQPQYTGVKVNQATMMAEMIGHEVGHAMGLQHVYKDMIGTAVMDYSMWAHADYCKDLLDVVERFKNNQPVEYHNYWTQNSRYHLLRWITGLPNGYLESEGISPGTADQLHTVFWRRPIVALSAGDSLDWQVFAIDRNALTDADTPNAKRIDGAATYGNRLVLPATRGAIEALVVADADGDGIFDHALSPRTNPDEIEDFLVTMGDASSQALGVFAGTGRGLSRIGAASLFSFTDNDQDMLPDDVEQEMIALADDDDIAGLEDCSPEDDADDDGLSNLEEILNNTGVLEPDSDGDGTSDGEEVALGSDPMDHVVEVRFMSERGGSLSGDLVQHVVRGGDAAPVTARATTGYTFDRWSNGDTDETLTITSVADDTSVHASFNINEYNVAFQPGDHGALQDGDPNVAFTLNHGDPAPLPPEVTVDDGWRFVGWQPALPEQIIEDWTGTAQYVRYNTWQLELGVAGAEPDTVTLGMKEGATFDLDNGLDLDFPLPGLDEAGIYFYRLEPAEMSYQTDVVGCADTGEWFLVVQAGTDSPVELSWDAAQALPPERYLTMYALGEDHLPVGGSAVNMADASERTVPAGETAFFILRYSTNLVADIALTSSWNLISLPLEPINSAVETVFDEANTADGTPRRSALRDGMRGTIYTGAVWTYYDRAYHTVTDLEACVGYWVFVEDPAVLLIEGLPPTMDELPLRAGWNLLGPPKSMAVPSMDALRGRTWLWDTDNQTYRASDELLPGRGHWMNAGEECSIDLSTQER